MGLEKYWRKRNFERTPEPHGEVVNSAARAAQEGRRFVIQKHAASHLHYDFRLEIGGTLKSWAVPKGPSLDPAEKRLAVEVEDHPLAYGDFEGSIPEGEYGGGTVLLWDRGQWIPEDDDPEAAWQNGKLRFRLDGDKLQGGWTLLRMGGRAAAGRRANWLLIKTNDEHARPGSASAVTEQHTASVLSGRGMDEIAAGRPARQRSAGLQKSAPARASAAGTAPARRAAGAAAGTATRRALPEFMPPQLATLVDSPPTRGEWLAEMKYDGYRLLTRIEQGVISLWSRNQQDWTARLPALAEALARLPARTAWLDGELIAVDAQGRSSFNRLQQALGNEGRQQQDGPALRYPLFDLLYLDGHDLRGLPQARRKELLAELLRDIDPDGPLRYSAHQQGPVDALYRHACQHGEEGLILKNAAAPYAGERSRAWLKLKCASRQEFVIGGFTEPRGSREEFGALLVGYFTPGQGLVYAGQVGTGFDKALLKQLGAKLRRLERKTSPFDVGPAAREQKGAHWVRPELVAEVRFAGWTHLERLRQAAFLGLRADKAAHNVGREAPQPAPGRTAAGDVTPGKAAPAVDQPAASGQSTAAARAGRAETTVAGVTITHPDRLLFPEAGLTKGDIARYYEQVAAALLPPLKDRPLTLVRCPQGLDHCFFQKHLGAGLPDSLRRVSVQEKSGRASYMAADSLTVVLELVQLGVLELHTWGARRDRLDRPDRLILDLDPAPGLPWSALVEGAGAVRELLDALGLPAFLKLTGGKGVHVEIPLQRVHGWDEVKDFAHALALLLAEQQPERFIARAARDERSGKIFIDYLRNAEGATAVTPYSVRARAGAPVALPIAWEELPEAPPGTWTVRNVPERLARQARPPWEGYEAARVRLGKGLLARLERSRD